MDRRPLSASNMIKNRTGLAIGLVFAFGGAALASLAGIPAPALVGATAAVTTASFFRLRPVVPALLRNISFAVIGGTLGAGVTPTFYNDVLSYPVSIAGLALSMALTMLVSGLVLMRVFRQPRDSALLATSPGGLSYSLALATDRGLDVRTVMVLQSIRLLLITMLLPPLLSLFDSPGSQTAPMVSVLGLQASLLVLLFSAIGGSLLERLGAPAAWLTAGLLVSGIFHASGLIVGRFAEPVTFAGFAIAGAVIGSRFSGITRAEMKQLSIAGVLAAGLAIIVSALMAYGTSFWTDVPFAQIWIAFAPGGVEGMSAMALALDVDPVFVATHHIFRILALIMVLPVILRWK